MSGCPSVDVLRQFLTEELGDANSAAVDAHVEGCDACQAALARISAEALPPDLAIRPAPAQAGVTNGPPERLLRELEEHTPFLGPRRPVPGGDGSPWATIRFPGPPTRRGPLGRLHEYEVSRLLGSGSTGLVYQAYDEGLATFVAIKVLRPELAAGAGGRDRFLREARAAAAVRHEHVVTVHRVVSADDFPLPYLVMEYVGGHSVADVLRRGDGLAPREAVAIVRQAAQGLAHAHRCGLVHRDVKPSNLLLDTDGRVVLTDFGLARAVSEPAEDGRPCPLALASIVGTPAYMSPEHVTQPGQVDARSDVYGLGVVLYELLAGQPPFHGPVPEVLRQVVQEEPAPPRSLCPSLPRELETITLKCLAKEPDRRYQGADELAAELERWQDGRPIQTRPPGPLARLRTWRRHHPTMAAAGGLASVVLTLLGGMLVLFAARWSDATARLLDREVQLRAIEQQRQEESAAARKEKNNLQATMALDQGLAWCEQGEVGRGMLWLARGLELAPADDETLQWSIRSQLAVWRRRLHAVRTALPHEGTVYGVAVSPDGRLVLTASKGQLVRIWDVNTGQQAFPPVQVPATAVTFSPDGTTFLTSGVDSTLATLWETTTGKVRLGLRLPGGETVAAAALAPDGRTVATIHRDRTVRLWEVATGKLIGPTFTFSARVWAVALSPDGRRLLTGDDEKKAQLWDAETARPIGPPLAHADSVTAVAFSRDGRTLLTGSKDSTARLWDAATGRPLGQPLGHTDKVYAVAFSPDGRTVLTGSKDQSARLWDVASGQPLGPPLPHGGTVYGVAFGPDGQTAWTGSVDAAARQWELAGAGPVERSLPHAEDLMAAVFSPGGKKYLTCDRGGHTWEWDTASGKAIRGPIWSWAWLSLTFRPGGRALLTGQNGKVARMWDTAVDEPLGPVFAHEGATRAAAFSPDGKTVLTGGEDRTARLWDAATGHALGKPLLHHQAVVTVAVGPHGRIGLTGCWDGTARLWDLGTGEPVGSLVRHQGPVTAVAFHPDGRTFATASRDTTAQLWDAATHKPVGRTMTHRQPILTAVFSPDGHLLATGGEDRTARLWETTTGRPVGPPLPYPGSVRAVTFSPDGRTLLVVGDARVAHLWEVPAPVAGSAERITLWTQVLTNLELDDDGRIHTLDGKTWQERHDRLEKQGGHPSR